MMSSIFYGEIKEDKLKTWSENRNPCQEFVLELDKYLTEKGSKRTIKSAKSGFVTSYSSAKSGKALLNYVFRRNGVKIRVYVGNVGEYAEILSDFPENMKKSGDCKKLNGLNCSPTCTGGYSFPMDGVVYKKCKNMAFFHSLEERNFATVRKLVESEIDYADRQYTGSHGSRRKKEINGYYALNLL